MINSPLVSVIVPCFNHEQYVLDCLLSILRQTYTNIELIVLDDGSSDKSLDKIKTLSDEYSFHFESHPNMGLPATLNKGIAMSRGKYIAAIASDDLMMLDRIEKQVSLLEARPDVAVCGGNMLSINQKGEVLSKQKIVESIELDFDDLFWKDNGGPPAPTAMIRKNVIVEVGGYKPDILVEDLYMWLKISNKGYKISILNDVLAYYRKHESNSHSNYEWLIENVLKIYSDYRAHPKYHYVVNQFLVSMFVKASGNNKPLAVSLLRKISWRMAPQKITKGIIRHIFSWGRE